MHAEMSSSELGASEGACGATEDAPGSAPPPTPPSNDTAVVPHARRRTFSTADKRRILQAAARVRVVVACSRGAGSLVVSRLARRCWFLGLENLASQLGRFVAWLAGTLFVFVFSGAALANSERALRVEATPSFGVGGVVGFFDNLSSAHAAYTAYLSSNRCIPSVPFGGPLVTVKCVYGGPQPDLSFGTKNGLPLRYIFDITELHSDCRSTPCGEFTAKGRATINVVFTCPIEFAHITLVGPPAAEEYCRKLLPPVETAICPRTSHPILLGTRAKLLVEQDFVDPRGALTFERMYRSDYERFTSVVDSFLLDNS